MKAAIGILVLLLGAAFVYAQESEEDAGAIGPENKFLYALDIVGDNIKVFLSRIGSEETHANMVRKVVAERRAERLRLATLKANGEITGEEYGKMVSSLDIRIGKNEARVRTLEQNQAAKGQQGAQPPESPGKKGNS